jgi:hypothetical protein
MVLTLAFGFVAWQLHSEATPQAPSAVALQGDPAKPASAVTGGSPAAAVAPPRPAQSPATKDEPASVAPGIAAASAPALFDTLPALQEIVRAADPRLTVSATAEKPTMTIGRDRLRVRIQSAQAGYVYLYLASTDRRVYLLFPNRIDSDNRIEAGQAIMLPKAGWNLIAEGPPGANHVVALVSRYRRDLGGSGLRQGRGIPDFDLRLAERWRPHQSNPFVGLPICERLDCNDAWGAALVPIEQVAAGPRS